MILINVQNNCRIGIHMKKGVVEFAGFTHKVLAASVSSVGINNRQLSADNGAWVKPGLQHGLCCHGRGCGFSVCSANTYAVAENSADRAQKLCTFKGREMFFCIFKLVISRKNGVCVNYDIRIVSQIFLNLTQIYLCPFLFYSSEGFGIIVVRAGNLVAQGYKYFRKRAHSRSAYTYKMQVFCLL